jgi:hypothetical protein
MRCFKCCEEKGLLIQGFCKECKPDLHREFDWWMSFMEKKENEFEKQTGKRPLEVWYEFEEWLQKNITEEEAELFLLYGTKTQPVLPCIKDFP